MTRAPPDRCGCSASTPRAQALWTTPAIHRVAPLVPHRGRRRTVLRMPTLRGDPARRRRRDGRRRRRLPAGRTDDHVLPPGRRPRRHRLVEHPHGQLPHGRPDGRPPARARRACGPSPADPPTRAGSGGRRRRGGRPGASAGRPARSTGSVSWTTRFSVRPSAVDQVLALAAERGVVGHPDEEDGVAVGLGQDRPARCAAGRRPRCARRSRPSRPGRARSSVG